MLIMLIIFLQTDFCLFYCSTSTDMPVSVMPVRDPAVKRTREELPRAGSLRTSCEYHIYPLINLPILKEI